MNTLISAKELRASLPKVVEKVRHGARFTVLYRSRAAFQIVPAEGGGKASQALPPLKEDSLFQAKPVGRSSDGLSAADHDQRPTAGGSDLRQAFARVAEWLQQGEQVKITRRGKGSASLTLQPPRPKVSPRWPDFEARLKRRFPKGVKGKPASEIIIESREER